MSITLDIPDDLVNELSSESQQLGIPLSEYVAMLLAAGRTTGLLPKSGAELVAYWREQGIIGSRPDIVDSQAHARQIRQQAESRARD